MARQELPPSGPSAPPAVPDPDIEARVRRILECLARRPGVLALAVVGSRAGADPTRVDRYSDLDLLVCCDEEERARLLEASWPAEVEATVLVFPRVMTDESRLLFSGLFQCELHFLSPEEVRAATGPCPLGAHLAKGFAIVHDPDALFTDLAARVRPPPSEGPRPAEAACVFWYNLVFCANLVMRGDLYRAALFAHWYLQLWLLELLFDSEEEGFEKYVSRKLTPEQYEAFAATIGPLTPEGMRGGLCAAMACFWLFQGTGAPDFDPEVLHVFREIEAEVRARLDAGGLEPEGD